MPPATGLIPRHASRMVLDAWTDTRVVLLQGPRQSGKSTLTTRLIDLPGAETRTLDDPAMLAAAHADPMGFVDTPGPLIIDEIQRAPDLLLAIKTRVDSDPRPGQFLLTGSARVLALRGVADALPGRVETIELWPLSQGEIDRTGDGFIDAVFADGPDLRHTSTLRRQDYACRVVRGGFPEAQSRSERRRAAFLDAYTATLVDRDIRDLAEVERVPQLRALLPMLAARSGSVLVANNLAGQLGISQPTVARYLALLEEVFLIVRVPAWSRNISTRATAAPKLIFSDSGVAANLLAAGTAALSGPTGPLGPLLEGFVCSELLRQAAWSATRVDISHYRTKDGTEVDLILTDRTGRVVAIEVKASATVRAGDFRGLRHIADRIGDQFHAGLVLHTGRDTLQFGPRLKALPISSIWQAG